MKLENLTFKGGVHMPDCKDFTKNKPIEKAIEPKLVKIPLHQHTGAPCDSLVEVGDYIKVGQKIGDTQAFVSAPIHSSVSGIVKSIETIQTPTGLNVKAVIIESDGKSELHESAQEGRDINDLTSKEIIEIIRDKGLTGLGGASFPTHVKLSPPEDKPINTIIVNGAECEPYLTSDYRVLIESPEMVVYGLKALMKALNVENGIIGIEQNKPEAIKSMKEATKDESNIKVYSLKVKYPQGDEKRLINATTGRIVPSGGLPMDVGCVVSNASTTKAVAEAIIDGKPLYERVVTVTGNGIGEPKNLMVKIGTPFKDIIEQCNGFNGTPGKIIMGGPMMGISQHTMEVPVVKGTSGILVFTEEEAQAPRLDPCIRCGKCLEVCPVFLEPLNISGFALKNRFDDAEKYNALDCIECGSCSYICPANRPLVESIRLAKRQILSKRKK